MKSIQLLLPLSLSLSLSLSLILLFLLHILLLCFTVLYIFLFLGKILFHIFPFPMNISPFVSLFHFILLSFTFPILHHFIFLLHSSTTCSNHLSNIIPTVIFHSCSLLLLLLLLLPPPPFFHFFPWTDEPLAFIPLRNTKLVSNSSVDEVSATLRL